MKNIKSIKYMVIAKIAIVEAIQFTCLYEHKNWHKYCQTV